jgi:hypothetical protein
VHGHRFGSLAKHRIDKQRESRYMIEMGMRKEDMIDSGELDQIETRDPGPCVEKDIVIQPQTGCMALASANATGTSQDMEFHFAKPAAEAAWVACFAIANLPLQ